MADGALARSDAHVAVAITGIAGPGGAVRGKPVGTVCFGLAVRGRAALAQTVRWPGDRAAVRAAAVLHALERLAAAAADLILMLHVINGLGHRIGGWRSAERMTCVERSFYAKIDPDRIKGARRVPQAHVQETAHAPRQPHG